MEQMQWRLLGDQLRSWTKKLSTQEAQAKLDLLGIQAPDIGSPFPWQRAKDLLQVEASGVIKWWCGIRYNGHRTKKRCICSQKPVTTAIHILHCDSIAPAFRKTSEAYNLSVESIKALLTKPNFDDW